MEKLDPDDERFLSAETSDPDGNPVLELRGELDMVSAVTLRETVEGLVAENNCEHVVFDLTDLQFMDSSGIAVLVFAANKIHRIELRNASPIIRRIIEVTGLSSFLRLDPQ
jgi:anti-sigma B factor antagonist